MMNSVFLTAGRMLRWLVFTLLLLVQPFASRILGFVAGMSMLAIVICLIVARDQTTVLIAFFSLGMVSVAVKFLLEWALVALAPEGFMMPMN